MRVTALRPALAVLALLAGLGVAVPSVGAASSPAQTYLAACSFSELEVAPSSWSPGCVGASPLYEHMSWTSWGLERSEASGEVLLNDCDPGCATGTSYRYPARLSAFRLRACPARPGSQQYTRLESSELLPAGNPLGRPSGWSSSVWKVDSSACTAQLPVFEQGTGVILEERPPVVDARRNIRPGSISGLDTWVVRKWRSFGGPRAVATATYWWHTPDGSSFRRFPVRLVLDRLSPCGFLSVYTRIHGRFLAGKPPGARRTISKPAYRYEYC